MMPLQGVEKVRRQVHSFRQYRHWTDVQTDGHIGTISRSACIARWRTSKWKIWHCLKWFS